MSGLSRLDALVRDFDPLLLLARLAGYGLLTLDGTTERERTARDPVHQHHAEILQAFALRHPYSIGQRRVPLPEHDGAVYETVRDLTRAFTEQRIADYANSKGSLGRSRTVVLESLRLQTQAVRNPAFPQHLRSVITKLYNPLDDDIERAHGVRAGVLLEMWFRVTALLEDRLNAHLARCRSFHTAKSQESAIKEFCLVFPSIAEYEELVSRASFEAPTLKETRLMLQYYADSKLPLVFLITIDNFVEAYNSAADELGHSAIAPEKLTPILTAWSKGFGDLSDKDPALFFLDNPVWRCPLIAIHTGLYYCPIPTIFLGFSFELFDVLTAEFPKLKEKLERRRAAFLEEEIAFRFKEAIPEAKVLRGTKWMDPVSGREYEMDVLVQLGDHLLVIEAKSGRVHPTAKRGAAARVDSMIDGLLVESTEQVTRFINFLVSNPGRHVFASTSGATQEFDTNADTQFVGVSVLLDHFGVLNDGLRRLSAAGFIDPQVALVPSITIYHLLCILDVLKQPVEVLHYFFRRVDFERHVNYKGDELDLLAFYLDTGLNIGEMESSERMLWIWGYSSQLEPWFMSQWVGKSIKKPKPRRTRWFSDVLTRLSTKKPVGWTLMASMLMNVSVEDQEKFADGMRKALVSTRRFGLSPNVHNIINLVYGPNHRREVLVGLALIDPPGYVRHKRVQFALAQAQEQWPDHSLLLLGQHCQHAAYPYDIIAMLGSPNEGLT